MMSSLSTVVSAVVGFGLTALIGIWFIPFLRKVHYGQTINDIGPTWHKNKQGTPTMGGIMFIIGSCHCCGGRSWYRKCTDRCRSQILADDRAATPG